MFRKILLAYDGSEGAKLALKKALYLASHCEAELFILYVGRIPEYAETVSETEEAREQANRYYAKILQSALEMAQEEGIQARTLIRYGKPGDVIVDVANEIGADLIVLGTRKHSPLVRRLLGATADKVVDNANCSVLVVR
jgi:nucleotide-binding universal stress UspA family protein